MAENFSQTAINPAIQPVVFNESTVSTQCRHHERECIGAVNLFQIGNRHNRIILTGDEVGRHAEAGQPVAAQCVGRKVFAGIPEGSEGGHKVVIQGDQ